MYLVDVKDVAFQRGRTRRVKTSLYLAIKENGKRIVIVIGIAIVECQESGARRQAIASVEAGDDVLNRNNIVVAGDIVDLFAVVL